MLITISIILFSISLCLAYIVRNLLIKVEKQEEILLGYMEYLNNISQTIEFSDEKLKKLDAKGSFESDDEIGFFFKQVKLIQEILNEFQIKKI